MQNDHQNGKGSKRRPGSLKAYEDGWERIYGKKKKVEKSRPRKEQDKKSLESK